MGGLGVVVEMPSLESVGVHPYEDGLLGLCGDVLGGLGVSVLEGSREIDKYVGRCLGWSKIRKARGFRGWVGVRMGGMILGGEELPYYWSGRGMFELWGGMRRLGYVCTLEDESFDVLCGERYWVRFVGRDGLEGSCVGCGCVSRVMLFAALNVFAGYYGVDGV